MRLKFFLQVLLFAFLFVPSQLWGLDESPSVSSRFPDVSDKIVCGYATSDGKWETWPARLVMWVKEAKSRGLSCGVTEEVSAGVSSRFPDVSDKIVCSYATTDGKWDTSARVFRWLKEAKSRGLSCGVTEEVSAGVSSRFPDVSDKIVCSYATSDGKWETWPARLVMWVKEAKSRGLSCGVSSSIKKTPSAERLCSFEDPSVCSMKEICRWATKTQSDGSKVWYSQDNYKPIVALAKSRNYKCGIVSSGGKLPECNSSYLHNCFGVYEWNDGDKYVGEWKNNKRHGIGTSTIGPDFYIGNFKSNGWQGEGVYIWPSGQALFLTNWQSGKSYKSNSTVQKVFPNLVRKFKSLSPSNRKTIQRSLKNKGFYESTIDGKWGRNTLIGIARFSSEYLRTVNLNDGYTIDAVIAGLQSQTFLSKVTPATQAVLKAIAQKKEKASKVAANAYRLEKTFKNYGALSRKQIQWSLKKRGYYKSSIDGLWGTGTKNAVVRFAQDKGLDAFYSGEVYDEVSRGLNVPSSFAVAKKQPKPSQNSGSGSNALGKLLLLGALCSMTPDATACISAAVDGGSSSSRGSGGSSYSPGSSSNNNGCSSDYSCGFGKICMKKPYSTRGICVTTVNRFGQKTYNTPSPSSIRPRLGNSDGCTFSSDCPIGFKCDRTYKMCIKR